MVGHELSDGPYSSPFPWWPSEDEDAESLETIQALGSSKLGPTRRMRCAKRALHKRGCSWRLNVKSQDIVDGCVS